MGREVMSSVKYWLCEREGHRLHAHTRMHAQTCTHVHVKGIFCICKGNRIQT